MRSIVAAAAFLFLLSVVALVPRSYSQPGFNFLAELQTLYQQADAGEDSTFFMDVEVLAKARPDECFVGIGDEGNVYDPNLEPPCGEGETKVNQAYVWGLTRSGDDLWFGTAPNVLCWVLGNIMQALDGPTPHIIDDCWVCEFGESQFSPPMPPAIGDHRPARAFVYNTETKELTEKTPLDPRLLTTLGLRSAGSLDNVVIMGGPGIPAGLNLFAWNADSGDYLGSWSTATYNNIRKWLVVDGVLYTTVGLAGGGGRVLRWNGDAENLWEFEEVGILDSQGAELAEHNGRLFVTTWPTLGTDVLAGLWMSPDIPGGGLTSADAANWVRIWKADDYEPDPVIARTYGGGALASFGNCLFWGTMHVPGAATISHIQEYGPPESTEELLETLLGSWRSISIFRAEIGEDWEDIRLAYGMPFLPVFEPNPDPDPEPDDPRGWWVPEWNRMGEDPMFGLSGFGNPFNNYTWTMDVFQNQLFVGTMDWSFLFSKLAIFTPVGLDAGALAEMTSPADHFYGADLWRFANPYLPAFPESLNGVGNPMNYGIRTMLAGEDALYLGTANPMNLSPDGGWELLALSTREGISYALPGGSAEFDTYILVFNPNDVDAPARVRFIGETGQLKWFDTVIPAESRVTIKVGDHVTAPGTVSTLVTSTDYLPLAVEKSVYWKDPEPAGAAAGGWTGGYSTIGVRPANEWHLAEGATHVFDQFVHIMNPSTIMPALARVDFTDQDGDIWSTSRWVHPGWTLTLDVFEEIGEATEVSTRVRSLVPVAVERTMYWPMNVPPPPAAKPTPEAGPDSRPASDPWPFPTTVPRSGAWQDGHASTAAQNPAQNWFIAEGATHLFDQFIFLYNPSSLYTAWVDLTFVREGGEAVHHRIEVDPGTRHTVKVNNVIGTGGRVATIIRSSLPLVAERSSYWPRGGPWIGGHNSVAVSAPALTWHLAEGATHLFDYYILVSNPSEMETATINLFFSGADGEIATRQIAIGPRSRRTVKVNNIEDNVGHISALVESNLPVVVERAMYWPKGGPWVGGHASIGSNFGGMFITGE